MNVLVYVEHAGGHAKRSALEATSKAAALVPADLAGVTAVVLGKGASATESELGRHGADRVMVCEDAVFDQYLTEPHVEILAEVVQRERPVLVMVPDTSESRDVAARLAARTGSSIISGVVDLSLNDGQVTVQASIFGGNYITTVESRNASCTIVLVRANALGVHENPRDNALDYLEYAPTGDVKRVEVLSTNEEPGAPIPLEEAPVIVAGGRGLGGPEPFSQLKELADALGGVVGASRAAVDAGWIGYSQQVGQTGRTVKPGLYIAIGISGAVQHRVGMQTADTIVAINRDPNAPVCALADLAVAGDLFSVVPALTAEILRRKGV